MSRNDDRNKAIVRLPTNATPIERSLSGVESARLDPLDTLAGSMWNPWTCPFAFLPYLAWAVSVDVWDDTWSEERKRAVIAAAPDVHRRKGTRFAVERSLGALGLDATIVEWFQQTPEARRGTFRIDLDYSRTVYSHDLHQQGIEAIRAAKPKSRVVTVRSVVRGRAAVKVSAFSRSRIARTASPLNRGPRAALTLISIGVGSHLRVNRTASPKIKTGQAA